MSDELDQKIAAAAAAAQPADQTPVQKKPVTHQDIQTAENTVAFDILPPRSQVTGQFDKNAPGTVYINGFIGLNKDSYDRVSNEQELWQNYIAAQQMGMMSDKELQKEGVSRSQIAAQLAVWEEYVAKNMPDVDIAVVNERQRTIFAFITNLADPLLLHYPITREKGLTNVMQRTSSLATGGLNGLVPSRDRGKFSLSDYMRRTALSVSNDPYNYDLLLRNSFLAFRFAKPDRLEAGELIANVAKAVRGHVRSVSQNLPALANIAAIREVWKFICKKIIMCSTKDTNDFDELADIIRITDINVMGAALLELFYPQGVNFNLHCLAKDSCNWSSQDVIDPSLLTIDRKWLDTAEEAAALANMNNFSRKYSREESLAFIDNTNYQHDIEPVWNEQKTACFILGVPSLTESFEAEEFFANVVQKELNTIRETSMTEEEYVNRREEFLNGLVGTDYLHYIAEYRIMPAAGTDGEPVILRRREEDPTEFNKGILKIIMENDVMATNLVAAVIKHYPFMSRTFVGLANYACENCKGQSDAYEDLGYTPINIVSAFFTLANLMYTGRSKVGENARQEALSGLSR